MFIWEWRFINNSSSIALSAVQNLSYQYLSSFQKASQQMQTTITVYSFNSTLLHMLELNQRKYDAFILHDDVWM